MNLEVRDLLIKDQECIVLGLGDGHHVEDLVRTKNLQKVYVIDRQGKATFPADIAERIEVLIFKDTAQLLKHPIMTMAMEKHLSAFCFKNDLKDFHRHLTGRSMEALDLFFKRYEVPTHVQFVDEDGQRYLSIKDLEMLIQEDVPPYLRLNCFRILKELVL